MSKLTRARTFPLRKGTKVNVRVKKLQRQVSALKSQVERKSIDVIQNYTEINSSGNEFALAASNIVQGTGDTERIGNKITAKSLHLRWQLKIGESSVVPNDAYNQIRLMVIKYETDDPSIAPSATDFLENLNVLNPEEVMVSPYKRDSNYQFNIMYDKIHNLYWGNNSGGTGGAPRLKNGVLKFKLRDKNIRYASMGPKTKIILLAISDSGATPSPNLAFHSRFYYTDK